MFAQVVFNRPLAESFTYRVPDELRESAVEGALVKASFARKREVGCIVGVRSVPPKEVDPATILEIEAIASPGFRIPDEVRKLAEFISRYYFCSAGEALAAASVVGFSDVGASRQPLFSLRGDWREFAEGLEKSLTPKQTVACQELEGKPPATRAELAREARVTTGVINRLVVLDVLEERDAPAEYSAPSPDKVPMLSPAQETCLVPILKSIDAESFRAFLLHGVTGSGKTEIYLQAMERARERGASVLCLVPEIALTPQTVLRFEQRFQEPIGVSHSQMTRREKLVLAQRIERGEIRIVIGARSAVFSPLPRLGLIVVDEEHDHSYKQSETPRYHGRDVAVVRAQRLGIPVILGSATPSLDSYANAVAGKYELLELPDRATGMAMPDMHVIDMTSAAFRAAQGPTQLSAEMRDAIQQRLDKGEQSILFLNRRGFSNFLFCPSCKWVARCTEDDVAMTYHLPRAASSSKDSPELDLFEPKTGTETDRGFLKCHFCGYSMDAPTHCPECKSDGLVKVGAGTQRIEEELEEAFPDANILRLDQDAAGGRTKFLAAWKKMVSGEAQIILGTQMIAKGLHLSAVTLVGVVLADVGLFIPDFRAEERVFGLLMQVSGRAGRESPGEVFLQTYMPQHASIRFAVEHDYLGYYNYETARRRGLGFPPYRKLTALTLSCEDRDAAYKAARMMASILWRTRNRPSARGVIVNGPAMAPMSRLAGRWRFRILLRGPSQAVIASALRAALQDAEWKPPSAVRTAIDVDPLDLL